MYALGLLPNPSLKRALTAHFNDVTHPPCDIIYTNCICRRKVLPPRNGLNGFLRFIQCSPKDIF